MKRDSIVWTITLLASVLTFLLGHQQLLQEAFPGLSPAWEARIELMAALIAAVSGVLHMSPLQLSQAGRDKFNGTDNGTVDPKRFTGTGGAILLALALGSSACGVASSAPPLLSPAPLSAAPAVPSELQKAADWAATAVDIVRTIQKVEIEAYRNGRVTDDAHRTIQTAMGEFFGAAIDALTLAQDLTKTTVTRWASAKAISALAASLLGRIDAHLPLITKGYVESLRAVLQLVGATAAAEGAL